MWKILLIAFLFQDVTYASPDQNVILQNDDSQPRLFDNFWKNIGDSFTGSNIYYHLAGIASTPILIHTGTDAKVYDTFRHKKNMLAWPGAILASGAGAAVGATWLYYRGDKKSVGGAVVVAQATIITAAYIKTLKVITGRDHPTNTSHLSSQEKSEQFDFESYQWKSGYGWPSGHVSHTVSVMSALSQYYPEKSWLKWTGIGLSAYMLYTVVSHDSGQMHWFSDGVAGAFMGYAIGTTVGRNLREKFIGVTNTQNKIQITPLVAYQTYGVSLTYNH